MRKTLDFLLYDRLAIEDLLGRERFADQDRSTLDSVFDACERVARQVFAPHNRTADVEEPRWDGERVVLPPCVQKAAKAYGELGLFAAAQDRRVGGMQMPFTAEMAANCFFTRAAVGLAGGYLLTRSNASLILAHGTAAQAEVFAHRQLSGRWFGTMCLSEPQAGSSLSVGPEILRRRRPGTRTLLRPAGR